MNEIEKRLVEERKRLESVHAPDELESRLRHALGQIPPKKRKPTKSIWKLATVVALFFIVIVGYQFNGFAYYGKKLLGFEEVASGTLNDLNDAGMGQVIDKKVELKDGTTLVIDGVMTDANQLIMYYTLHNQTGLQGDVYEMISIDRMTGFLTNSHVESGTSIMNDDGTEIKGMMTFEPVSAFSKQLTLHYWQYDEGSLVNENHLTFAYNPNQAMQTEIKQSINETLEVDRGRITFKTITATPTVTVIEGSLNVDNYDRVDFAFEGVELMANGERVELKGHSSKSTMRGNDFDIRYDALPEQLDSLEIVMNKFVGYAAVDEKISLAHAESTPLVLGERELLVNEVVATEQGIEVKLATDDDVMLDGVSIEAEDQWIPLTTTLNQTYFIDENGREWKERTLLFKGLQAPDFLVIEGMHYMKVYDVGFEIPVQ
ncbi:DUF4179 domain-containing protein [Alkalihalophilus lindianensis]|uniref:DUF4179 domain-containing protein n=1 Tax=Alkalihalophilus lindianensis TaxID=1630542 RepID=A0ABU3X4U5_9BACI|nr:DUF4179 domain-containing protein [Alkalihalophilus lindianensis]MDV2682912.1 DUF4179 domain-containing protein [Alkalihalophilus lindianensis]